MQTLLFPFIILREKDADGRWKVTGQIRAERAIFDEQRGGWKLVAGKRVGIVAEGLAGAGGPVVEETDFLASDLKPAEIPLRRQEGFTSLLGLTQLDALIRNPGTRTTDMAELRLQKQMRITEPIMNLILLLVALPVLICRDPKNMKSAVLVSFVITTGAMITAFLAKLFATEPVMGYICPEFWAWVPIFIFLPVAFVQIDSMKT
jgi:lipopolysaccharide export LptBFGC system permease protein LptF